TDYGRETRPDGTPAPAAHRAADPAANPFRFGGEYTNTENGTDYTPARLYHPETGRFTTRDPHPTPLNKYQAFAANPIEHTDPSGNLPFKIKIRGQGKRAEESRQRTQALESARKEHYESSARKRLNNARGRLVALVDGATMAIKKSNWPEVPAFTSKVPAAYQNYEEALASYTRITGHAGPEPLRKEDNAYITAASRHFDLANKWSAVANLGIELQGISRTKRDYELFEASLKQEGFSSHMGTGFQDFALAVARETLDKADESEIEKQYIEAWDKLKETVKEYKSAKKGSFFVDHYYVDYLTSRVTSVFAEADQIAKILGV
ncbi:RHS repeat-associated core domain-containing protein, partial [Streptomyces sp. NRRL F-2664]|uniref:RHS repeat-associated core domain-containing protein n=1 Tax=Streptomyces sp. NRRL F-2664 TaxID=1463842 RepID=UPI00131EA6D9